MLKIILSRNVYKGVFYYLWPQIKFVMCNVLNALIDFVLYNAYHIRHVGVIFSNQVYE